MLSLAIARPPLVALSVVTSVADAVARARAGAEVEAEAGAGAVAVAEAVAVAGAGACIYADHTGTASIDFFAASVA